MHLLFEESGEFRLQENLSFATSDGDHAYNDILPEVSVEVTQRRLEREKEFLDRGHEVVEGRTARCINSTTISSSESGESHRRVQVSLLSIPVINRSGFYVSLPQPADRMPFEMTEDDEEYTTHLPGFASPTTHWPRIDGVGGGLLPAEGGPRRRRGLHDLSSCPCNKSSEASPLRRHSSVPAFVEGRALFAERLGLEMDVYRTPYSNFARISYEMIGGLRLVVNTAIHVMGGSRQEAINYMLKNPAPGTDECGK